MTIPTLYTLQEVANQLKTNVSALREEVRRGRLRAVKIGRKVYVTESDIAGMIEACRVEAKDRDFTSGNRPAGKPSGSSETGSATSAQVAAEATLEALKHSLRRTSQPSTPRRTAKAASNVCRLPTSSTST